MRILLRNRRAGIVNRRAVTSDGGAPCCCGGEGCCDFARGLRFRPGDPNPQGDNPYSETYPFCCNCGKGYKFSLSFFRRASVTVQGPTAPAPNGLVFDGIEQLSLSFTVECINGVRRLTPTPNGLNSYTLKSKTWAMDATTGQFRYHPIDIGPLEDLGDIFAVARVDGRPCGMDYFTFTRPDAMVSWGRSSLTRFPSAVLDPFPVTFYDYPGPLWNTVRGRYPLRTPSGGEVGAYSWDGEVDCAHGLMQDDLTETVVDPTDGSTRIGRSNAVADWSISDKIPCDFDPCADVVPDPVGRCCLSTVPPGLGTPVNCLVTTDADCQRRGGSYGGDASHCEPFICPTLGKCCLPDGTCTHTTAALCTLRQGLYGGDGSVCAPGPCLPTGACCLGGGCVSLTALACSGLGGVYRGDGTDCATVTPPCNLPPLPGSCCLPDGSCLDTTQSACADKGGIFATNTPCANRQCFVITSPPDGQTTLPEPSPVRILDLLL